MLIAIFAYLALSVFGGGSERFLPKDFDKQVKKQMTDEVRKDQVLDLNQQIGKGVKTYHKRTLTLLKDIRALTEKHDTTADEFQAIVDELFSERRLIQGNSIDARLKLKGLITREEWGAIFSATE